MADRKKPAVGATVAPPDQNADFLTQIQNTFERGVVSAEVDLSGLYGKEDQGGGSVKTLWGEASRITTGPAGVHNQLIHRMKEMASSFGGRFTTHAPLQTDPANITRIGRSEAAHSLKNSLEYTKKLGANVMTIHPIGRMGYYFIDPFVGSSQGVPNPFMLAADKDELNGLFKKFNVRDPLLKKELEKSWENWVQVLPTHFAQQFGAQSVELMNLLAGDIAQKELTRFANQNKTPEAISDFVKGAIGRYDPRVAEKIKEVAEGLIVQKDVMSPPQISEAYLANMNRVVNSEQFKHRLDELWAQANLATLAPIAKDGKPESESEIRKAAWKWYMKDKVKIDMAYKEKLLQTATGERRRNIQDWMPAVRMGPFEDAERVIMTSVVSTFKLLLSDPEVKKTLQQKNLKLAIENLFPAAPDKGYMAGFSYFYKPEHMAKLIKELKSVAKANGVPEDRITMTFDVGHAAASGIKPTKFLEDLKKHGIKPGHVHLVGGPGYGEGHIAWGDWLDEVSRMDPGVMAKLVDMGVVNIEGGAGLYDAEVTLNAMWNEGVPLEALMAIAGGPTPTMSDLKYTGFKAPPYWAQAAQQFRGTGLAQRAFYSFSAETAGAPMQTAFGSYSMPGFTGGGYLHGPPRTPAIWGGAQPLLYSGKSKG
ncbi:MAG TPA: sugar phosphate isomerase/epimerase [archaeon]|nr:sugar phosphate isomerase/epimerase [archaeon]